MSPAFLSPLDYKALSRCPDNLPQADLIRFFSLSKRDLQQLALLRGDHNRLGFALQLCCLRCLGFCPDQLRLLPQPVIDYVAQQLQLDPVALNRYGHRPQTCRRHRQAVEQYLGFRPCSQPDLAQLKVWLLNRAQEHDKPALLLELAVQKLYHDKRVRPAISTLERLITEVRSEAMQSTFELIQPLLSPPHYQFLDQLLLVDESLGMTPLAWLRRPATMNSPRAILKTLRKLQFLNQQGIASWNLARLNPNRLKFLAQLGKRSSNQVLQRAPVPKRYSVLVAFVCQIRLDVTDEAIDLFIRCLADTYARARRDRESAHIQAEVALNEKVRLLQELGAVLLDLSIADDQVRSTIFERVPQPLLEAAIQDCGRLIRPHPDHYLDFFVSRYSYLRQFIPAFLVTLQFRSVREPHPLLEALLILRTLDAHGKRQIPVDAPTHCLPQSWKPFLLDEQQQIRRRYYELGILWQLRLSLRSGAVWLDGSRRYAPPNAYLIPPALWPSLRSEFTQLLQCPTQPHPRLKQLAADFQAELLRLNNSLDDNELLRLEQDRLVISPLPAQELPDSAAQLQLRLGQCLPKVDLTDLLIEVDLATQFSHCLTHAGGDPERSHETSIYLYAAIIAQACNLGVHAMAQSADLSYDRLLWHTHWFLREETLQPAIDAIVNYHAQLPLAKLWGGGTLSSSDGQRFPVAVKNQQATALPKYFGYGKGVTFYTWTSDQFSQFAHKVIPSTIRDATYVLDGILDNHTELNILEHSTDTAGYTEIIFALFDLLGLQFSPRIRDLASQQLFHLSKVPFNDLKPLFTDKIDQAIIIAHWDDLLQIAASLKFGWVSASLLVSKLQALPQHDPIFRALQQYSRLVKSIFILRYLNFPQQRRQIHAQLNKGESLHALRQFLLFARQARLHHPFPDDLTNQAACLTLLTNAVVSWNTVYIQKCLDSLAPQPTADLLAHPDAPYLSPARFLHINPYGKFRFDLPSQSQHLGFRSLNIP